MTEDEKARVEAWAREMQRRVSHLGHLDIDDARALAAYDLGFE